MTKLLKSKHYNQVYAEVKEAYADCWCRDNNEGYKRRNLNFKASEVVSPEEAKYILKGSIPYGYNEFNYKLLDLFPANTIVRIAREGSVCLYVEKQDEMPTQEELKCNEADEVESGIMRYWWD